MSNWQGGIRVNAFASGGLIPAPMRGTQVDGLITGADAYATFCGLAGVDPTDAAAAAAGLPPIDSLDMWPMLSGANKTSPRAEVVVATDGAEANMANGTQVQALIRADGWKLIIGATGQNIWTGELYPNATTKWTDVLYHCGVPGTPPVGKGGCLFNILSDPTEHHDVAAAHPDIVADLHARIVAHQATAFSPNRGVQDNALACAAVENKWDGRWGPFLP